MIYSQNVQKFVNEAQIIGNSKIISRLLNVPNQELLRQIGDNIRSQIESGVICLAAEIQGKASIIIMVTSNLTGKLNAKDLIQQISPIISGGGGGRPSIAQAGGTETKKLPEAMDSLNAIIKKILTSD